MTDPVIEATARDVEPSTDVEVRNVAALAPIEPSDALIRPAAKVAEVEQAFRDYQTLCASLLDENDVQHISGKTFRKKSAWRKLAVAFGVTCEIVDRTHTYDDQGRIVRTEIVARATAPNGRSMDGLGLCDLREKCYRSGKCTDPDHDPSTHFSHAQHDVPATAATRATNRACADLFGMGEVSAEEVVHAGGGYNDDGGGDFDNTGTQRGARQPPAPPAAPPMDWESLGYMSMEAMRTAMKQYTDRANSLTTEERDTLKAKRAAAGLPWPPSVTDLATMAAWVDELEGPM